MKQQGANILVMRFSALGDAAMLAPILKACAKANRDTHFTMAGPQRLGVLFQGEPNLSYIEINKKQSIRQLYSLLRSVKPSAVADLHSVTRSFILRSLFFFTFHRVVFLHKGRRARRLLCRQHRKRLIPLPSIAQRYCLTLSKLGIDIPESAVSYISPRSHAGSQLTPELQQARRIGIAPFARHKGKIYPLDQMEVLVAGLSRAGHSLFFFGGGAEEKALMEEWESRYAGSRSTVGKYNFEGEMELLASLDLLVSMDSANMHFASCLGVPVVSVWGATHPYAGFYPALQDPSYAVQTDLPCRPCSVYGQKPCLRGDYACMKSISPKDILDTINKCLYEKPN